MIASLGDIIFQVSSELVRTINGYKRSGSARFADHDLVNRKPTSEFIGPGLETISFSVQFNAFWGVKPEEELEKLRKLKDAGKAMIFVLGEKPVGDNYWVITDMPETSDHISNKGEMITASAELTIKEYVAPEGEKC